MNNNDFAKALASFTGMKVTLCQKCGEMLAHRNGQPLPCTSCKK